MINQTAKQWYDRAYKLHYKAKDYKEAYATYKLIVKGYPDNQEAQYSLQQMENIKKLKEYDNDFEAYALWFADSFRDVNRSINCITKHIDQAMNIFPAENLTRCDLSVFSRDEKTLYYCPYGQIAEKFKSMLDNLDTEQKIAVVKDFIFNVADENPVYIIPLNSIVYYQDKGDIAYSTSVSGGGGSSKSMSLGGAAIGGLLFGEAGAIVGSRAGTGMHINEIHSETIEHDNRYVVLRYRDEKKDNVDLHLSYDCYDALNKLIPDKEYSYISLDKNKTIDTDKQRSDFEEIPVRQLRQLKELLDDGIITQEDFDAKKKSLLGI